MATDFEQMILKDRMRLGFVAPDTRVLTLPKPPQSGAPLVVMVHGTWAPDAQWTERTGPLFAAIEEKWPGAGLHCFQWRGRNGLTSRIDAADSLAATLIQLKQEYPHSPLVAIAHSHGGNVLAWASTWAQCQLAAAVYLNTPFFQATRRRMVDAEVQGTVAWWFAYVLSMRISLFAVAPRLWTFGPEFPAGWFFAILAIAHCCSYAVAEWVQGRIGNIRQDFYRFTNATRHIDAELCVHVAGDEANAALATNYFVGWFAWRLLKVAAAGIAVLIVASMVPVLAAVASSGWAWTWIVLDVLLLTVGIGVVANGPLHGLIALDTSLAVASTPLGKVEVLTVQANIVKGVAGLHSSAYSEAPVVEGVVSWLSRALRA